MTFLVNSCSDAYYLWDRELFKPMLAPKEELLSLTFGTNPKLLLTNYDNVNNVFFPVLTKRNAVSGNYTSAYMSPQELRTAELLKMLNLQGIACKVFSPSGSTTDVRGNITGSSSDTIDCLTIPEGTSFFVINTSAIKRIKVVILPSTLREFVLTGSNLVIDTLMIHNSGTQVLYQSIEQIKRTIMDCPIKDYPNVFPTNFLLENLDTSNVPFAVDTAPFKLFPHYKDDALLPKTYITGSLSGTWENRARLIHAHEKTEDAYAILSSTSADRKIVMQGVTVRKRTVANIPWDDVDGLKENWKEFKRCKGIS